MPETSLPVNKDALRGDSSRLAEKKIGMIV